MIVEYDGTDFVGWQSQKNGIGIQDEFERVFKQITGTRPLLRAAGRTDAGVHARAQNVSFKTTSKLSIKRLNAGLNALLPKTISVHRIDEMPLDFDAKRHSLYKLYRYTIYKAPYAAAQLARYAWHIIDTLDVEAMKQAAAQLVGTHDFESFRSAQCQAAHARRHLFSIEIKQEPRLPGGSLLHITYRGDAFVRHMCRILTGTLVEMGRHQRDPNSIPEILAARSRKEAGATAPPQGLCLLEVGY